MFLMRVGGRREGRIRSRVAIVTGASSGIGRATALALARGGARVSLAARNAHNLSAVALEIEAMGRDALCVPTDVTDKAQVNRLVAETLRHWGRVDILVANAGSYIRKPVPELTVVDVERSMQANFYSALYPILSVLPNMLARGRGHIVLVSSMDGKKGLPLDAPYVAAKFALAGLGDVMRQELRAYGVYVTGVFPGRVDTPMIANLRVPWISAKISPEVVARAITRALYKRKGEVIVPFHARGLLYVNTISPALGDWIVRAFHLEGRTMDDSAQAH